MTSITMTQTLESAGRYGCEYTPTVSEGWRLERLTPASKLHGANGLRDGVDGKLYVAQCIGSEIAAIDPDRGTVETVVSMGSEIVAPDDLAFDESGKLYVTECMNARVSVLESRGRVRILNGDLPGANGITFYKGRLFVDECRLNGRLLELNPVTGEPRVLLEGLELPNALDTGPDGYLYFPLVGKGEIWRIHPDGGQAERVARGLNHPVAVKFDARGRLVAPQSGSGDVLCIDIRTGQSEILASLAPGLDNLAFVGERLFVSHHTTGQISEIRGDGSVREVIRAGFMFPLDIASDAQGRVVLCDNSTLHRLHEDGSLSVMGRLFAAGYPGSVRGIDLDGDHLLATTTDGRVVAYYPEKACHDTLLAGLDEPCGIARDAAGNLLVAEKGKGRVLQVMNGTTETLVSGLVAPMGVAVAADSSCFVADSATGRIHKRTSSGTSLLVDGFVQPQGIALQGSTLYVVDAGGHSVWAVDTHSGQRKCLVENVPVGPRPGIKPKPLLGMPPLSGPFGPFAGIAVVGDNCLYFSAHGEGSVLRLRPAPQ